MADRVDHHADTDRPPAGRLPAPPMLSAILLASMVPSAPSAVRRLIPLPADSLTVAVPKPCVLTAAPNSLTPPRFGGRLWRSRAWPQGLLKNWHKRGIQYAGRIAPMIPPFNESGFLPAGIHPATLPEIQQCFGSSSKLRRVQMDSVRWMIDLALQAGVERIVLNGSFTTDILEPNDVDCVLLWSPGIRRGRSALQQLRHGLPFLSIALVDQNGFDELVDDFFATDRLGIQKGMIEVIR